MRSCNLLGVLSLFLLLPDALAVKPQDFKTCSQAGFCRRGRALSERAKAYKSSWESPYSIDSSSIVIASDKASFTAGVRSSLYPDIRFGLELRVHKDGVVRVRMDELNGLRKRYDEAASWALISEPEISDDVKWIAGQKDIRVVYGTKQDIEVTVTFNPLRVSLLRNGKEQVVLNGQGLLHMEHFRTKTIAETKSESVLEPTEVPEKVPEEVPEEGSEGEDNPQIIMEVNPRAWFEGDTEDNWWEETFSSWTDSKPKGKPYTAPSTLNALTLAARPGVIVTRHHVPKPWHNLRYPATCNSACPPLNDGRLPNVHRTLQVIQRRRLRIYSLISHVLIWLHPRPPCALNRIHHSHLPRSSLGNLDRRLAPK